MMTTFDFSKPLKIGTRGSVLAKTQTEMVAAKLKSAWPQLEIETAIIKTSGDWKKEQGETRLAESKGGKGLFIQEIEAQILDGRIDCGVHSLKDVPTFLEDNLSVDHVLEREDPRDAFISDQYQSLADMPANAVVGTASLRRQAAILKAYPHLKVEILRGNVDTRLKKMREGQVDAAILAVAGLERINRADEITSILDPDFMVPACGQGALAIETRIDDTAVRQLFDAIHHDRSGLCTAAERATLAALDGSCRSPIGCYATLKGAEMTLHCVVYEPDGSAAFEEKSVAVIKTLSDAKNLGLELGNRLKPKAPARLFA